MLRDSAVLTRYICLIAIVASAASGRDASGQVVGPYADWELVLLPVYADAGSPRAGAENSSWVTYVTVTNGGTSSASLIHYTFFRGADIPEGSPPPPLLPDASFSPRFLYPMRQDVRGPFLGVDRAHVDDVQITLRARDLSRAVDGWGTTIPVVREKQWFRRTVRLNDIAVDNDTRTTLRVYGFDGSDPLAITIRVYGLLAEPTPGSPDELLREINVNLDIGQAGWFPAFAEIHDVASIVPVKNYRRVRIDVSPADGKPIWAFATVTNNTTQHVTVIAPSQ